MTDRELLEQALDALHVAVSWGTWLRGLEAVEALRNRLAQPEQEPVAWMYDWEAEEETITNWLTSDYDEAHSPTMRCTNIRPLYTSLPQRKPLTNEEIGLLTTEPRFSHIDTPTLAAFARAVIAKATGEKGE